MGKVKKERIEKLERLLDAVDEILQEINRWPRGDKRVLGAINWDDLACGHVRYFEEFFVGESTIGYEVLITGASSGCGLSPIVHEMLEKRGYGFVEVRTEWS